MSSHRTPDNGLIYAAQKNQTTKGTPKYTKPACTNTKPTAFPLSFLSAGDSCGVTVDQEAGGGCCSSAQFSGVSITLHMHHGPLAPGNTGILALTPGRKDNYLFFLNGEMPFVILGMVA